MRRRQLNHFAEVQRAQLVVEDEQRESEKHVAHAGNDKRLHRRGAVLRIGIVEPDQQIGAQAHAFPAEVHQQQVVAQHQHDHACDKQVGVGEEARIALFPTHIPGGIHVDQETYARYDGQHGQRQAVEHQVEADIKIAHRHPGPQRLNKRLAAVVEEINARNGGHQRRQADRANPHRGGQVLRPASARKCQQYKANKWQKNG